MTYFVSYDIAHPKRLRNVAKIIEKYGKLGAAEPMNDPFLILQFFSLRIFQWMFYDGVLLTKTGMKKVVSAFEKKMQTKIFCEAENENLSIQKIIFSQVQQYKRFGSGEQIEYKPFYGK